MNESENSATVEMSTNEKCEELWSSEYNQIINNCKTVMTRSKYRALQKKLVCQMGPLLVSLSPPKRFSGKKNGGWSYGSCDHVCQESYEREWRGRRTGCRRRPGVAENRRRKKKASSCSLKKRLLECARDRKPAQAHSQLVSFEIPDPTPVFPAESLASLPSTSADSFYIPQPPACNSTGKPVSGVSPFGMSTLQNTCILSSVKLMPKQPSAMDTSATKFDGMIRELQPETQQKHGDPEITEHKLKEKQYLSKNFECHDEVGMESWNESLSDVFKTNLENTTLSRTLDNAKECEVGVARQTEFSEAFLKEKTIDDKSNTICFSKMYSCCLPRMPESISQQNNWTPKINVINQEKTELINTDGKRGNYLALKEWWKESPANELIMKSEDTTTARITENNLNTFGDESNNFDLSMSTTHSIHEVSKQTYQLRNCDPGINTNNSEEEQHISMNIPRGDGTELKLCKEEHVVNVLKTTSEDITSPETSVSKLDCKVEDSRSKENIVSMNFQSDETANVEQSMEENVVYVFRKTLNDTDRKPISENKLECKLGVSQESEQQCTQKLEQEFLVNVNRIKSEEQCTQKSEQECLVNVNRIKSEQLTSSRTSGNNLEREASQPSEHYEANVDVETQDDEMITLGWSVANTRGSVVSDIPDDMDVDSECADKDPAMAVPDVWCDTCRRQLASAPDVVSLSQRYRLSKWIESLLGFVGLVNIPDDQRERDRMLTEQRVHSADCDASTTQRGPFF